MIAITGATGQLGRLAIARILSTTPAARVVAAVRQPAKAADLAAQGVQVRRADYDDPASLGPALAGVERLLLISSSEVGRRTAQHRNIIEAAWQQRVKLLVYTSLLHADTSTLDLAAEHRETEALIKASGIPYILLRNGWYAENHTASIPAALAQGAFYGSAGGGRISWASRADYTPRPQPRPSLRTAARTGPTNLRATPRTRSQSLPPRSPGRPARPSPTEISRRRPTRRRCSRRACPSGSRTRSRGGTQRRRAGRSFMKAETSANS